MGRIEERFLERTPRSAERDKRAREVLPGGDTRAAGAHRPYPLTLERGWGPHVVDVDGNEYLDLLGNYTSLVHGHAYPPITEAIRDAAGRGTAWPARCDAQIELASLIAERVESVEQLRFTNSGSEATMLAAEIARAVTGRHKVLMARHGYHGSAPHFECGFMGHESTSTRIAPFGDADAFEAVLREDAIACVILEPVMGSAGIQQAPPAFFARVREAAHDTGALFVLDEVICFRLAAGGAQSLLGVEPDLTAFGKLIGGGLPVGAVGGRAEVMRVTDPAHGTLSHSGTFNGNPVTCAAGAVSVRELTPERIAGMDRLAARLEAGLVEQAAKAGLPLSIHRAGSVMNLFLSEKAPPATLVREDYRLMSAFHLAALNHGLFFAPRGLFVTSTVLTDALVDAAIERAGAALADVAAEAR